MESVESASAVVGRSARDGARLFRQWYDGLGAAAAQGSGAAYVFVMGSMAELLNCFGFQTIFPEINSLQTAVRRVAHEYLNEAEEYGYSPDICGYVKADVAVQLRHGEHPMGRIPPPVLAVLTNSCNTYVKWAEIWERLYQIPVFVLDIPGSRSQTDHSGPGDAEFERDRQYVVRQMRELVTLCEKLTGRRLDEDQLRQRLAWTNEMSRTYQRTLELNQSSPAPFNALTDGTIFLGMVNAFRGTAEGAQYCRELREEMAYKAANGIGALPGVRDVSVAFRAPLSHNGGGIAMSVTLPGHPEFSGRSPVVIKFNSADYRYFRMLGIRVLKGRALNRTDTELAPRVAVISDAMARRYWPAGDPIGKHIRVTPGSQEYQIVGVVADAPINEIGEVPEPYIYTSWWQNPFGEHTVLIETQNDAAALAPIVRATLAGIEPEFKRAELFTMDELVRDAAIIYRAAAQLVAALAALGLILAAVGFYGVTAYGVTLRTREIGIRMAVGARQSDAASVVVRQALAVAAAGIGLGLPCSIGVAYGLRTILFGISPWYGPAFVVGSITMLSVAIAAALIPALRAARVDPLVALRCE